MTLAPKRRPVRRLSDAEEAEVQAGIAADPDNPELTDAQLAEMRPAEDALPAGLYRALTKRGRPKSENKRVQVTLRMDPGVIEAFKSGGPGWQTRMNEVLERAARKIA
ncbi:BrnA antitoxin family protein [Methylobacterium trifolii]|uniref:BrnA antitoxin family protein n=1 Tax=Methylobacterium trifolii TaxID=1003092 RepID=A0ABQ4U3U0_9HYPH|nr:BrnA antitoxin family protein [Methylobacterium trifolii]GJE62129.1 hypothetical protein MPOCJGCO_4259 [Methylobacterium trifolii]